MKNNKCVSRKVIASKHVDAFADMEAVMRKLHSSSPVVVCMTNYVTMQTVADILLAIGASPVICDDVAELEHWACSSDALVINIGTLHIDKIYTFKAACKLFIQQGKPVIFDPMLSGSVLHRTELSKQLAKLSDVVRGNAREIMSLASHHHDHEGGKEGGSGCTTVHDKGVVAATYSIDQVLPYAHKIAAENNCTVVISGKRNFCIDHHGNQKINTIDVPLMASIAGMGCAMTAVIGAFHSVIKNSFDASVMAVNYYKACARIALQHTKDRPATFKAHFIDTLYRYKSSIKWLQLS